MLSDNERMDLWERNRPLALFIAKRWFRFYKSSRVEFDDIAQCAFVGLWKATGLFDPAKGIFSVLASWRIRHEIQTLYLDMGSTGRVPKREKRYFGPGNHPEDLWDVKNGHHESETSISGMDAESILSRVTDTERQVMMLRFERGWTWTKIAKHLGTTRHLCRKAAEKVIFERLKSEERES